jgi:hypothetical protein
MLVNNKGKYVLRFLKALLRDVPVYTSECTSVSSLANMRFDTCPESISKHRTIGIPALLIAANCLQNTDISFELIFAPKLRSLISLNCIAFSIFTGK